MEQPLEYKINVIFVWTCIVIAFNLIGLCSMCFNQIEENKFKGDVRLALDRIERRLAGGGADVAIPMPFTTRPYYPH